MLLLCFNPVTTFVTNTPAHATRPRHTLVGSEDAYRRMSMHVAAWLLHLTFLLILTAAIYFCKRTRSWESPASKTRLKSTESARAGSKSNTETIVGPRQREHGSRVRKLPKIL